MAMKVHDALRRDMDRFIKVCAHLFHDKQLGGHLSLSFCIQFLKQRVNIIFQHVLNCTIERKIALVVTIVVNLPSLLDFMICMHVTLRGAIDEITSYHESH